MNLIPLQLHFSFDRLFFPKQVIQNGEEEAKWDCERSVFNIKVPKLVPGEHFEDLDMLTKLLTKPVKYHPVVEVLETSDSQEQEDDYDWMTDQTPWTQQDEESLLSGYKYGFAHTKSGVFERLKDEVSLAIDLKDPGKKSIIERRKERMIDEDEKFDDDHYLTSLYEDREEIDRLIEWKGFWEENDEIHFTEDERFRLKNLPRKDYLLDKEEKRRVLYGLIDILFAFSYDARTTEGDHTSESNWTICKVSGTLSWLERFDSLKDTMITCVRRSLSYPLHRDWRLSMKVLQDVHNILKCDGKTCLLKCLLKTHHLLNHTVDSRYILNDLYLTDYCVWIQTVTEKTLKALADSMEATVPKLTKEEIGFDILLLETAAEEALREQEMSRLVVGVQSVEIK